MVSAFVEARSCERFRLLAEGLLNPAVSGADPDLGMFYLRLADAEARHWERFRDLTLVSETPRLVERRIGEMAGAEASIVSGRPLAPRMH